MLILCFFTVRTIPTFQGQRLIVDEAYLVVRNPKIWGEMLFVGAFAIPLIFNFAWPPFLAILFLEIQLILRAQRIDKRCLNRYNSAWVRYTSMTKCLLVPRIF